MSFMSAALLAAWVVLILMAFAMAGLLRQQRDMQAAVIRLDGYPRQVPAPVPARLRPARQGTTLAVLIVDHRCTTCPDVLREFLRLVPALPNSVEAAVLTYSAGNSDEAGGWVDVERNPDVRLVVDAAAYHVLDPGWRPALLQIDHEGAVVREVPVGSPEALAAALSMDSPATPATPPFESERKTR